MNIACKAKSVNFMAMFNCLVVLCLGLLLFIKFNFEDCLSIDRFIQNSEFHFTDAVPGKATVAHSRDRSQTWLCSQNNKWLVVAHP